jgi:hypothetical protein
MSIDITDILALAPPFSGSLSQIGDLIAINTSLADLFSRVGRRTPGGNPHQFLEFFVGGTLVEVAEFEPDPATYRHEYYYNATTNRLYKRIITANDQFNGTLRAYWQGVSG